MDHFPAHLPCLSRKMANVQHPYVRQNVVDRFLPVGAQRISMQVFLDNCFMVIIPFAWWNEKVQQCSFCRFDAVLGFQFEKLSDIRRAERETLARGWD